MKKKILVADDSITVQKVIEMAFAGSDYDIFCARDGKEAFEKFRQLRPDIVLADVIMPELDGYSLCSSIKSNLDSPNVPVVLLSGAFEPFDREKAESSGADGIITKPFESSILIEKINKILHPPPKPPVIEEENEPATEEDRSIQVAEEISAKTDIEDFPINLDDAIDIADPAQFDALAMKESMTEGASSIASVDVSPIDRSGSPALESQEHTPEEPLKMMLSSADIDAIAKKLLLMISHSPLREAIREAISEIAEKIIRERIRELEDKITE